RKPGADCFQLVGDLAALFGGGGGQSAVDVSNSPHPFVVLPHALPPRLSGLAGPLGGVFFFDELLLLGDEPVDFGIGARRQVAVGVVLQVALQGEQPFFVGVGDVVRFGERQVQRGREGLEGGNRQPV